MVLPSRILLIAMIAACTSSGWGQTQEVTTQQLQSFLGSSDLSKVPDAKVAARLSAVRLKERLSEHALVQMLRGVTLGEQSAEALDAIVAESQLQESPRSEWLPSGAPDAETEHRLMEELRAYVRNTLDHLPDFVTTRETRTIDNSPLPSGNMKTKPIVRFHFVKETRREVTIRDGQEMVEQIGDGAHVNAGRAQMVGSFESWGDFGPILHTVLSDSAAGSLQWIHWEQNAEGHRVAVFRYRVPKAASHYGIDFCCYQENEDAPWRRIQEKPGYRGDIDFDTETSTIAAVTLLADLDPQDVMAESGLAVQYGRVIIGGRTYVCPLRSVAISADRSFRLKAVDGIGVDRHVNVMRYVDYHKFGSDARVLVPAR